MVMILLGKMSKIVIDGDRAIFGRMASNVVKELLKGNSVDIINCANIIISGGLKGFVSGVNKKRQMGRGGSLKGPKYSCKEEMLVKRMIRGMLPRDRSKGREAFKRLRCHVGEGDLGGEAKTAKKYEFKIPMKYFQIKDAVGLLKNG